MTDEDKLAIMREMAAKGGSAKVPKGFASADVMRKAIATRKLRANEKKIKKSVDST